jgi:hypothetical protein
LFVSYSFTHSNGAYNIKNRNECYMR